MKNNKILDSLYYTFSPELNQIKFANQLGLKHQDILLVINLSKSNLMIFNFGSASIGGTFNNGILTLVYNTNSMSSSDKLMILIRDEDEVLNVSKQILQELRDQKFLWESLLTLNTEDSILGEVIKRSVYSNRVIDNEFTDISTITTTLCKAGPGTLKRIVFNSVASPTVTIYDSLIASGKIIAIIDPVNNTSPFFLDYDIKFSNGLTIVSAGTQNMTIVFN